MYFAALNLDCSGFLVVAFSGVDGLKFPGGPHFTAKFIYGNSCFYFFFRLVGMTIAKMASIGPMMRLAHMKSAAMPKMT